MSKDYELKYLALKRPEIKKIDCLVCGKEAPLKGSLLFICDISVLGVCADKKCRSKWWRAGKNLERIEKDGL